LLVNWHKENAFDNTLETNQHYFFQVDLNKTIQKLEKLKFFFDKNQKHESTVNAINFFQKHFIVHEDQLLSILDNSQQAQHFITEHKKYFKKIPCDQRLNVLTDYVQNRKKQMLTELSESENFKSFITAHNQQYKLHPLKNLFNAHDKAIELHLMGEFIEIQKQKSFSEKHINYKIINKRLETDDYVLHHLYQQQLNIADNMVKSPKMTIDEANIYGQQVHQEWQVCHQQSKTYAITQHRNVIVEAVNSIIVSACQAIAKAADLFRKPKPPLTVDAINPNDPALEVDYNRQYIKTNAYKQREKMAAVL